MTKNTQTVRDIDIER